MKREAETDRTKWRKNLEAFLTNRSHPFVTCNDVLLARRFFAALFEKYFGLNEGSWVTVKAHEVS